MFFCHFLFLHKFSLHKLATSADAWHPRQMPQRPSHQDQPQTHEDFYFFCFLFYSWFFLSFLNITLLQRDRSHVNKPYPTRTRCNFFAQLCPFPCFIYTQKCRPIRLCKRSSAWNFTTLWWHVVSLFGTWVGPMSSCYPEKANSCAYVNEVVSWIRDSKIWHDLQTRHDYFVYK